MSSKGIEEIELSGNEFASLPNQNKFNLKEKISEDTLDLSLCGLETIPIKEIAEFTKLKKLNLSSNALKSLPEDLSKLKHIKEIDLSKNHLTSLPKSIGSLSSLKTLDLQGNDLTHLPDSFGELKLQWLDLKDNPLHPELLKVTGECLVDSQCKKCAANVIKYQREVASKRTSCDDELNKTSDENSKTLRLQRKIERERRRMANEKRKIEAELAQEIEEIKKVSVNAPTMDCNEEEEKQTTSTHNKSFTFRRLFYILWRLSFLMIIVLSIYVALCSFCVQTLRSRLNLNKFFNNSQHVVPVFDSIRLHVCPKINTDILQRLQPLFDRLQLDYKNIM